MMLDNGLTRSLSSHSGLPPLVSPDICSVQNATYPQGCPIMSPSKTQTPSSPAQHTNVTAGPKLVYDPQPHPSTLAAYGIKVRDFAYESTLPPVAIVPRVPRQIQPDPRAQKRSHIDHDENDPFTTQPESSTSRARNRSKKLKSLERKLTEPAEDAPVRRFAESTVYDYTNESSPLHTPFGALRTFISTQLGVESPASSSQPPIQSDSQDSEPYIETPLVTPNGSLQWQHDGPVPISPLERNLIEVDDRILEYSMQDSQADDQLLLDISPNIVLSPQTSKAPLHPSPDPVSQALISDSEECSQSPSPFRYYLRTRPNAGTSLDTPSRSHSRTRTTRLKSSPYQAALSAQSVAKSLGSSRGRTMRKGKTKG